VKHADADITSELHDEQGRPRELLDLATIQAILQRYEYASPTVRQRVARQIERGPIGELVKDANGRCCQICVALGQSGKTFRLRNGKHYVEAHHVELVSSHAIGVLRVSNVVTLCANHHRELHFGAAAVAIDNGEQFMVTVEQGTVRIDKATIRSLAVKRPVK
jgi:predicted HNH restriction endonuclease